MKKNTNLPSDDDEWIEAPPALVEAPAPSVKRDDWMNESFESLGSQRIARNVAQLADHELTSKELVDRQKANARIDRELNPDFNSNSPMVQSSEIARKYEFGDKGSSWRMMKLKRVFEMAERDHLSVEDVALERYASLEEFQDAIAERDFLDGKLHRRTGGTSRKHSKYMDPRDNRSDKKVELTQSSVPVAIASQSQRQDMQVLSTDQLNKLYSKLIKAQMMGSSEAEDLKRQYEMEKERSESNAKSIVYLPNIDSRGNLTSSKDTPGNAESSSISDMIRNEKLQKSDGIDDVFSGRIMTDGGFKADLEYLDERADQLATKKQKTSHGKGRRVDIMDFRRSQQAIANCAFCSSETHGPRSQIIAQGTRVFLAFPETIDMVRGHCIIVPNEHVLSLLDCDDDEWTEIRNFQKSVIRMFDVMNQGVIFMEQVISFNSHHHAVMECIPLHLDMHSDAPAYFKEAIMASEQEWSQHIKLIDTSEKGIRRSMVKNLPYFHVWFDPNRGYGHVIEDSGEWKEWFGREVVASMLDLPPEKWRKPRRPTTKEQSERKTWFQSKWHQYDWTRLLSA